MRRTREIRDPVTIFLDDEAIVAERGEPIAVALLAAGKLILARSPKLHRPRGPTCFRGGCDGCLSRVDGLPNIMTCLRKVQGGERIETQNVVGSRRADLLRVTDWFFPKGIDHHHLLAGVPGLGEVMQSLARKVAGLGRLPAKTEPPHPACRLDVDAVIVGAGPAGIGAAHRLETAGLRVALVDDNADLGGSLLAIPQQARPLLDACPLNRTTVLSSTTAAAVHHGELLVVSNTTATVIRAPAMIFATGAHDGVLAIPGNDLPCVFSARALCRIASHGVVPNGTTVIVGDGYWADALVARLDRNAILQVSPNHLLAIRGTGHVKNVIIRDDSNDQRTLDVVAVAAAVPSAPVFELAAQAGATLRFDPERGYAVTSDEHGRAAQGTWAVGECTGRPFDPQALLQAGAHVAENVIHALGSR